MSRELAPILDGKYRLLRKLGSGSMGSVYLGENIAIGRKVAIKVMHHEIADCHVLGDRFEREARAAARIRSPHIVEVLDLGKCTDGLRYIVMEHLEGETLEERLLRGPLALPEAARIAMQMLTGIAAAHDAGIIHRDIKPENVFLATREASRTRSARSPASDRGAVVKILDFGVSKGAQDTSATVAGALLGTPDYMSPEQARGRPIDARTDLYAVGVVLYEMVSGKLPFVCDNVQELLFKIALEPPTPLEGHVPGVDAGFAAIVRHAMARDPERRYRTAQAFYDALLAWSAEPMLEAAARTSGRWSTVRPSTTEVVSAAPDRPSPVPARMRATGLLLAGFATVGVVALLAGDSQRTTAERHLGARAREAPATKVLASMEDVTTKAVAPQPSPPPKKAAPAPGSPAAATPSSSSNPSSTQAPPRSASPSPAASNAAKRVPTGIGDVPGGYRIDPYEMWPY